MSNTITVSPSAIGAYEKCGVQYAFRYVEHVTPPVGPSPSAVRGRALHRGAETDLRAVAARLAEGGERAGADLPLAAVQQAASDEFDRAVRGESLFEKEDGTVETRTEAPAAFDLHGEDPGVNKDLVLRVGDAPGLVPVWYTRVAPSKEPAAVETWARLPFETPEGETVILRGRIDDLPREGVPLADLKHSKRAFGKTRYSTEEDAANDDQLTAYDLLHRAATGRVPAGLGFDTVQLDAPRNAPEAVKVTGIASPRVPARSDAQIALYLERVAAVAKGIKAGVYVPAHRGEDWWCSEKWCAFWKVCKHGGGR